MSCPNCFTGELLDGEPTGKTSEVDGAAYFAPGPENATSKRAIILLTDIFGLPLKNSKILADNFAKCLECDVYVPDLFAGHPPVTVQQLSALPEKAGVKLGVGKIAQIVWKVLPSIPAMIRNKPSAGAARALTASDVSHQTKHYEKLGAVGYCYGGGVAVLLGSQHPDLLSSIVLAHPSNPTDANASDLVVTAGTTTADIPLEDMGIKPARLEQLNALYKGREGKDNFVEYEFTVYPGTAHGFAARPALKFPEVKEGFEKAFQQTVGWFNKTIPHDTLVFGDQHDERDNTRRCYDY
ncbi:DLH domain-containing protein [Mycena indigotica]|uniref:DLH domain-containing protein n=1 Tax=Mycena indigotica TaxID=2126181 RepID=A0A8H6SGE0_9AGAR|nr:DLH domain-containing protein [Mycena indigotica]KAF7299105.1 DLH domain-containing protein [Mycena indigotica]